MKIVIASDSFKESLCARDACAAIARAVRQVRPSAIIDEIPMADGGEGTVDAMVAATHGTLRHTQVTGPLGEPVVAQWGMLGDGSGTGVIEMASASGLALVPPEKRNPLNTTTFGTGELIRTALDGGALRVLIGIGGSATTDGGTGAAQAIGVRFFDVTDRELPRGMGGRHLAAVARIDLSCRHPRLASATIQVACDVDNPLCGERGAAAVYGPQKGASPEQVRTLDEGLSHLADCIWQDLHCDVRDIPGAGAAGGLGAGLVAFFGARLDRGIQLVMQATRLEERIAGADLVITGEGRLDRQSMMGKVISGVGAVAKAAGIPAIALVGSVGEGADEALSLLRAYHAITPAGTPRREAYARAGEFLEKTAATVLRQWAGAS